MKMFSPNFQTLIGFVFVIWSIFFNLQKSYQISLQVNIQYTLLVRETAFMKHSLKDFLIGTFIRKHLATPRLMHYAR